MGISCTGTAGHSLRHYSSYQLDSVLAIRQGKYYIKPIIKCIVVLTITVIILIVIIHIVIVIVI